MPSSANAADLLCETLTRLGVEVVFGVPGTQSVVLYESMRHAKFRTITACSELGALFMANGYYRASGRPGVAMTIAGPGFSLGLTGLAEAHNDSVALLQIVGSFPNKEGRSFQLQEIDVARVAGEVAKSVRKIESTDQLQVLVIEAYRETLQGEPRPIVVDFPAPLMNKPVDLHRSQSKIDAMPAHAPDPATVGQILEKLRNSQKPIIFIGQGAADTPKLIKQIAELLRAPVVTNCSGHGVFSDKNELLVCSDFSGWGVELVNQLFEESDCIMILGAKLSHNGTSGFKLRMPKEKLIRVDSSAEVLGANYPAEITCHANLVYALPMILEGVKKHDSRSSSWSTSGIASWKKKFVEKQLESAPKALKPEADEVADMNDFFLRLRKAMPSDSIIVTDSGLHQILTRRLLSIESPRGLIVPSDFQSMGFGVGAAIGAVLAAPNRNVICIIGDGGLAMAGMELLTAVREGLDLMVIVFNDGFLGQIRVEQLKEFGSDFGTAVGNIDIQLFAEAIGASYFGLYQDFDDTLHSAIKAKGVRVVDLPLRDSTHLRMQTLKRSVKNQVRSVPDIGKLLFMKRRLKKSKGK